MQQLTEASLTQDEKSLEDIKPENRFPILAMTSDLIFLLASFLDHHTVVRFGMASVRLYSITKKLRWAALVYKGGDILHFLARYPDFVCDDLTLNFGEFASPSKETIELCSVKDDVYNLDDLTKLGKQPQLFMARLRNKNAENYFAFLKDKKRELFSISSLSFQIFSNQDKTKAAFFKAVLGKINVLELICSLQFNENLFQFLLRSIQGGAELPPLSKTRENFTSTSNYFEHLIKNIHDLLIALRLDPELINEQDKLGRTLLFYPALFGVECTADHLRWVIAILSVQSKVDLSKVDSKGNTLLHEAVNLYLSRPTFKNSHIIDNILAPLVKLAAQKNFDFQILNGFNQSVLHLAAMGKMEYNQCCPVRVLLDVRKNHPELGGHSPDPDQQMGCSGPKAFAIALSAGNLPKAERLSHVTTFDTASLKENLVLLQSVICDKFDIVKKFEIPVQPNMDSKELIYVVNILRYEFNKFKKWQILFFSMIAKLPGVKVLENQPKRAWFHVELLSKLVSRIANDSVLCFLITKIDKALERLISALKNPETTLADKENLLYMFLASYPNKPVSQKIKQVFEEELIEILQDVYRFSELIIDPAKKADSRKELRTLLVIKLLQIEKSSSKNKSQEVADYFNSIVSDFWCFYNNIDDIQDLFKFLLIYQNGNNASEFSFWQSSKDSVIVWQEVIENIRKNALKKVRSFCEVIGSEKAVAYLAVCRELSIFSLPNSLMDRVRSVTAAVAEIDTLKEQYERENFYGVNDLG